MENIQSVRDQAHAARDQAREQVRQALHEARDQLRSELRNHTRLQSNQPVPAIPPIPPIPAIPADQPVYYIGEPVQKSFNDMPPQVAEISIAFFGMCAIMVIGWPIARAIGRRVERRAEPPALSGGMTEQLQRIEQAVEAMSIEVERISESQRFMARLQQGG